MLRKGHGGLCQAPTKKEYYYYHHHYYHDLATRQYLMLWNLSQTSDYCYCFQLESLLYVFAGCITYLDEGRYTWRHDSMLNFLASSLPCSNHCTNYRPIAITSLISKTMETIITKQLLTFLPRNKQSSL